MSLRDSDTGKIVLCSGVDVYERYTSADHLLSNTVNCPVVQMEIDAFSLAVDERGERLPYKTAWSIGPKGGVITQVIVYKKLLYA